MSLKAARAGGDNARPGGRRFDLLAPEYEYLGARSIRSVIGADIALEAIRAATRRRKLMF